MKIGFENNILSFTIKDTGEGMSKEKLKRSLKLFGNIDTFKEHKFLSTSGIGVGLSSSYKLAKALGGNLEVVSKKKLGTQACFSVQAFKASEDFDNFELVNDTLSSDEENIIILNMNVF